MSPTNFNAAKRKASTAFKPPRPSNKTAPKSNTKQSANGRRKHERAPQLISSDDEDDDDDDDEDDHLMQSSVSAHSSNRENLDQQSDSQPDPTLSSSNPPPTIPPALLTKLLHHHFKDRDGVSAGDVRIGKDAMAVVGKYIETFVREAIARAAFERQEEIDQRVAKGGRREVGDDFLEVSIWLGFEAFGRREQLMWLFG
ncbi:uncharacterized protein KY384_006627 [Bacidia gigantensis]|uniref:uncharacterized protein n=1 Tax=Bacidia gigantensis TaxID=2732470 RepID=UPI001D044DBD|nr:uncharacterized protein KY384_006627 [Bacidia gigantensis]KAG8528938.1 hypothetical protein KY384_006627 [Bacidia gigantensis]